MYQESTDHLIWTDYHTDFEEWKESTSEDYEDYSEDRLYEIFCEAISDNPVSYTHLTLPTILRV